MKINFQLDPSKAADRDVLRSILAAHEPQRTSPPADLQIHTPTTDAFNRRADRGVTVYTSPGNEAAAVASVEGVLAEGETVENVGVDSVPMEDDHDDDAEIQREAHATGKTCSEVIQEKAYRTDEPDVSEPNKGKPPTERTAGKPTKTEKPAAKKADKTEAGKQMRLMMLEACKLPGVDIAAVNEAIFAACDVSALKDVQPDQAPAAIASIQALIDGANGGEA